MLDPDGYALQAAISAEQRVYERCDMQSIGACMENMALAAISLGLGSLWIGDTCFAHHELTAWFQRDGELIAAMSLGNPDEQPPARPRAAVETMVEWR